jgi:Tfp pilus assembly protein PilF
MPTKKNEADTAAAPNNASDAYEAALAEYNKGIEALRREDYGSARELFEAVRVQAKSEPELGDRATTYARICERKLAPASGDAPDSAEMYRTAVFLLNSGDVDEALTLLNRALVEDPMSVDVLYVRACAWALKGAAEKAVGDLRQAMAVDPKVRFQAVNDPDFENIREEPSFIDIIEPTANGA